MKTQKLLGALAVSAIAITPISAHAGEQIGDFNVSANVGFVTDYVFRGISQSDENFAVQGGFDVGHTTGLYAGIWGSNVDFNDGDEANIEIDLYAGYANEIAGINYDVGAIYYAYPGADSALDYDFYEVSLALGYDFDVASASASVNYSPEFFGDSGDALYYSLNTDIPLPADFTLSGHVGYQSIDDNDAFGTPDYTDWSIGIGYNLAGFDLSLQYIDTDLDEPNECADGCEERFVFGVSRSF